jgi:GMP synthase (glutamine-hydrolysing)
MRKLLIIKCGTTLEAIRRRHGDFEDHIIGQTGIPAGDVLAVPVFAGSPLPPPDGISAVIVTGSHAMVTDHEPWSRRLAWWLRNVCGDSRPVLGLCYGHQILADAWGGSVAYHPRGWEVGTAVIGLSAAGKRDPLLGCLPDKFLGHVFHAQTVAQLPPGARLLAKNAFEPHHAFVLREKLWGVQFHPEFDAAIMRAYLDEESESLARAGADLAGIQASLRDHPYGRALLRRFVSLL